MSVRATALVWERTRAKGSNLLMLLAIADYAKDDGRWAWPSARTLRVKARLSARAGELILMKLVRDGEIQPEWDPTERRLYLHLRCVMDWTGYQREGEIPTDQSEKIARNQNANFSLRLLAAHTARTQTAAPKAHSTTRSAQNRVSSLLSDPLDPSGSKEQGLRPDHHPVEAVENPEESLRVITKLAHETYDLLGTNADSTELAETLKSRCANLGIPYRSDVIYKALDSAKFQRERLSKEVH